MICQWLFQGKTELVQHQDGHTSASVRFLYTAVIKLERPTFKSETGVGPKKPMFTQTLKHAFQITCKHFYTHLTEELFHKEFINKKLVEKTGKFSAH